MTNQKTKIRRNLLNAQTWQFRLVGLSLVNLIILNFAQEAKAHPQKGEAIFEINSLPYFQFFLLGINNRSFFLI